MRTILITGANRGIGLEHARRYAQRGVQVFATARDPDNAADLNDLARQHDGRVKVLRYDAAEPDAAAALRRLVGDAALDLLLANAGAPGPAGERLGAIDMNTALEVIRVNALAPLQLAQAFAGNVAASARKIIAFQSSLMGSIGDNRGGGYYAYRLSKAALNMAGKGVSNDLKERGVIAVLLHPGWVRTRMGGPGGEISIEECVEAQQRLLDKLTLAHSGRFFNFDGAELPW